MDKVATAKLYDRKNALIAADTLNDRVLPFFEQHGINLLRILTDRGTEYCGAREHHEYELYLALEDLNSFSCLSKTVRVKTPMLFYSYHKLLISFLYYLQFLKYIIFKLTERPFLKVFRRQLYPKCQAVHFIIRQFNAGKSAAQCF
jgi:hypothetical protein